MYNEYTTEIINFLIHSVDDYFIEEIQTFQKPSSSSSKPWGPEFLVPEHSFEEKPIPTKSSFSSSSKPCGSFDAVSQPEDTQSEEKNLSDNDIHRSESNEIFQEEKSAEHHFKDTVIECATTIDNTTIEISANLLTLSESIKLKANLVDSCLIPYPIGHVPYEHRKGPLIRMRSRYFREHDSYSPLYRNAFNEYLKTIKENRMDTYANVCWVYCNIIYKWLWNIYTYFKDNIY
jgi:hypothetical protein